MKDYDPHDRQPVFVPRSLHQRLKTRSALTRQPMTAIAAEAIRAALDGKPQSEQRQHG